MYMLRTEASSLKKTNPAAARTQDSDSGSEPMWMCAEVEVYVGEGHTYE